MAVARGRSSVRAWWRGVGQCTSRGKAEERERERESERCLSGGTDPTVGLADRERRERALTRGPTGFNKV
jgi:hypothetical protein